MRCDMGKITLTNIAEELSARSGLNKEAAENFVKAFVETIEKGLRDDNLVKVKGLGTFKLMEMSDRSSVDVNTGERITIKGYNKVTFTPDSAMKEFVNRPFSHFEPTELNEGYPEEELAGGDVLSEENEEGEELEIVSEPNMVVVSEAVEDPVQESGTEFASVTTEDSEVVEESEVSVVNSEVSEELIVAEEKVAEEGGMADEVEETSVLTPVENQCEPSRKSKKRRGGMVLILLFLLVLAAGAIHYFMPEEDAVEFIDDDIVVNPNLQEELGEEWNNMPQTNVVVEKEEAIVDSTEQKDTMPVVVAQKEETVTVEAEPSVSAVSISKELKDITLADTTGYAIVGTQVVHTLRKGETIISLSNKYYGDKRLWPYIVKHNNIVDFNKVAIGMKIAIPTLEGKAEE